MDDKLILEVTAEALRARQGSGADSFAEAVGERLVSNEPSCAPQPSRRAQRWNAIDAPPHARAVAAVGG